VSDTKLQRNVKARKCQRTPSQKLLGLITSEMKVLGLSQAKLGELLGVSQATISSWLSRPGNLSLDQMLAIADALYIDRPRLGDIFRKEGSA